MRTKSWAIFLVLFLTLMISTGQVLWKLGSKEFTGFLGMITNTYVLAGFAIYGIAAGLLIIAFKGGDLSVLYPIFATSYIWVSLLSIIIFKETITTIKWAGILLIIIGIGFIGRGSR